MMEIETSIGMLQGFLKKIGRNMRIWSRKTLKNMLLKEHKLYKRKNNKSKCKFLLFKNTKFRLYFSFLSVFNFDLNVWPPRGAIPDYRFTISSSIIGQGVFRDVQWLSSHW